MSEPCEWTLFGSDWFCDGHSVGIVNCVRRPRPYWKRQPVKSKALRMQRAREAVLMPFRAQVRERQGA